VSRASTVAAVALFTGLGAVAAGLAYTKARALATPNGGGHEPAQAVAVALAREVRWAPTADLVGTVFSLRSVLVKNERPGVVKEVRFASGALVEAGQVLVTLDDAADRADLAAAEASVRVARASAAVAKARLSLAETEIRRMEEVFADRGISEIEIDRGRSELSRARADHDRALAEADLAAARVEQVSVRLSKAVIRAPFRARAGIVAVHEGQFLPEGEAIVALEESADRIYLDFAIPQEHLGRVRVGTSVMASSAVLGPDPTPIEVAAVDATVDGDTRNVRVRAVVADREGRLRPGMFVRVNVPVDEPRPYVVVPSTAVRRTPYADQVFLVAPADPPGALRAKSRFVKLGPTVGDDVIVLEGLAAGDEVAATGSFKLWEGALVTRAPASKDPAP
jgi:membrane fusion protein (multidrug efflux system)